MTTPDVTGVDPYLDGNLRVGLATWIYLLHVAGVHADDEALHAACTAVSAADDEAAGDAAGTALVERVVEGLAGDAPADVQAFAERLYGDRLRTDLGEGDRQARHHRIRAYQFRHQRPWLARIWERHADGRVAPSWLVIERVTDVVDAVDPNPWNDVDEDRRLPVSDFDVQWELDACTSFCVD